MFDWLLSLPAWITHKGMKDISILNRFRMWWAYRP
jgi:hypothetical protein